MVSRRLEQREALRPEQLVHQLDDRGLVPPTASCVHAVAPGAPKRLERLKLSNDLKYQKNDRFYQAVWSHFPNLDWVSRLSASAAIEPTDQASARKDAIRDTSIKPRKTIELPALQPRNKIIPSTSENGLLINNCDDRQCIERDLYFYNGNYLLDLLIYISANKIEHPEEREIDRISPALPFRPPAPAGRAASAAIMGALRHFQERTTQ